MAEDDGNQSCLDLCAQVMQVSDAAMVLQLLKLRSEPIRQGCSTARIQSLHATWSASDWVLRGMCATIANDDDMQAGIF